MTPISCNNVACKHNYFWFCKSPEVISIDKHGMCEAIENSEQKKEEIPELTDEEYAGFVQRVNKYTKRG